jgi:hypothetical protein
MCDASGTRVSEVGKTWDWNNANASKQKMKKRKSTNATDGHERERERTDWKTDEPRLRARRSLNTTNAVPASHP